MKLPHGAPYTWLPANTVVLKFWSSWAAQGRSFSGTRFFSGAMAWNSEPELYSNTSSMSPVDSRVLIRLSPSLPPGRDSTLMVTSGFLALKSFTSWLAMVMVLGALSTRKFSVTLPPLLSLEPRLPALHAPSTRPVTAAAARTPALRILMGRNLRGKWSGTEVGRKSGAERVRALVEAAPGDRVDQFGG